MLLYELKNIYFYTHEMSMMLEGRSQKYQFSAAKPEWVQNIEHQFSKKFMIRKKTTLLMIVSSQNGYKVIMAKQIILSALVSIKFNCNIER